MSLAAFISRREAHWGLARHLVASAHPPGIVSANHTFLSSVQYPTQSNQPWRLNDPGKRTCERHLCRAALLWLTINPSVYLESAALHFNFGPHR
jgi:hypothetical protein